MSHAVRLLIVADAEEDTLLLVRELRKGGIDPCYARVETAEELETALKDGTWDAVFADREMPSLTGLDALRIVRGKMEHLPFLLVSEASGEEKAVEALHAGANDYLIKGKYARLVPALERAMRDAVLERERRQTAAELAAANKALNASLADRDFLLRELAHRTKNNMQVISSVIGMQAVAPADPTLAAALADTQNRIRAMALVHEKLYRSREVSSVKMKDYVADLVNALVLAHAASNGAATVSLDVEELAFPIDAAVHCGLIINELVSNSLKHASPRDHPGAIFLALRRLGEQVELAYRDDGPGLPEELDLPGIKTLGLKLVHNLATRQLRGKVELLPGPGTAFVFRFGIAHLEKM